MYTISRLLELNIFFLVSICFFFSFIFWKFPWRKTLILCKQKARQFLFALNCCGILCLSGYLAVTIFCHPSSLYLDKAMYKTLWLTCLFVLGIWFQNIIWIAGFKFHGPSSKWDGEKFRRPIDESFTTYQHTYIFFLKGFNFTLKILLHWLPLSLKGLIILLQIHVPLC